MISSSFSFSSCAEEDIFIRIIITPTIIAIAIQIPILKILVDIPTFTGDVTCNSFSF